MKLDKQKVARELLKIADEMMTTHYVDPRLLKDKDGKMKGEDELDSLKGVKKDFDEFHTK